MRYLLLALCVWSVAGCGPIPVHTAQQMNESFRSIGQNSYSYDELPQPQLPNQQPSFGTQQGSPQTYYINTPSGLVRKTCQTTRQGQTYCY